MIRSIVSEIQKRSVPCPECAAAPGKPCRGSRIPSAASFGGGWGGPPNLDRAHSARRAAFLRVDRWRVRYVKGGGFVVVAALPYTTHATYTDYATAEAYASRLNAKSVASK